MLFELISSQGIQKTHIRNGTTIDACKCFDAFGYVYSILISDSAECESYS